MCAPPSRQGGRLVFWRLAVKPGRPAAMGVVAGTPVVGLPGNPVAAVVTFLHLARPLVLRLAGAAAGRCRASPAEAAFSLSQEGRAAGICAGARWAPARRCRSPINSSATGRGF